MPFEPPLSWPDMNSKRRISNRRMQDKDSLSISFADLRRRVHHPDIVVGNNNIFLRPPMSVQETRPKRGNPQLPLCYY
jgi:hypothetical protein